MRVCYNRRSKNNIDENPSFLFWMFTTRVGVRRKRLTLYKTTSIIAMICQMSLLNYGRIKWPLFQSWAIHYNFNWLGLLWFASAVSF